MKKQTLLTVWLLLLAAVWVALGLTDANAQDKAVKIKISFNNQEVVVEMFDNPASQDFLSMLPLTGSFDDYARAEKITYLARKLNVQGSPDAGQVKSDFTYYAPWGNLAVFYKGFGSDKNLYPLGKIISGKNFLEKIDRGFTAEIKRA